MNENVNYIISLGHQDRLQSVKTKVGLNISTPKGQTINKTMSPHCPFNGIHDGNSKKKMCLKQLLRLTVFFVP